MMMMAVVVTDDHGSLSLKRFMIYTVLQQLMTFFSGNLTQLKDQFRVQVQDQWDRRSRGDPAVNHDIAYKAHGWSNYLHRGETTPSEELGRKHSRSQIEANRNSFESLMPRLTVYHRSTQ